MKIILTTFLSSIFAFSMAAMQPTLSIKSSGSTSQPSITLTADNASEVSNIKFNGLKGFSIIGREVSFSSSSEKNFTNKFETKLYLKPLKAETNSVFVTANVNDKNLTSNKIDLSITKSQLDAYNANEKKESQKAKIRTAETNKQIMVQIKEQQKFFNNINSLMQKQEAEMLKQQQEMMKAFN